MNDIIIARARDIVNDMSSDPRRQWGLAMSDKITFEEVIQRHLKEFAREIQMPAAASGR